MKKSNETLLRGQVLSMPETGVLVELLDRNLQPLTQTKTDHSDGHFEMKVPAFPSDTDTEEFYVQVKGTKGEILAIKPAKVQYEENEPTYLHPIQLPDSLQTVEFHRSNYKFLTTINPNYFGNLSEDIAAASVFPGVFPFSLATSYEQLTCVGLNTNTDELEAVIRIKRPTGYGGPLCSNGTLEHVAFFVDYGSGFIPAGAPVHVRVHDLAFNNSNDVFYAVRCPFHPKTIDGCAAPQVVRVRAILSWESIPTGPNYVPVWGNTLESWVQIRASRRFIPYLPDSIIQFKPNVLPEIVPKAPVFTLSGNINEIKEAIYSLDVTDNTSHHREPDRSDLHALIAKNPNYFASFSDAKEPAQLAIALAKLPEFTQSALLSQFTLKDLLPVKSLSTKTRFEELLCVGLLPEEDLLEAVVTIKEPTGFNGNLCSTGSTEYVAFYADWGSGYEHVGTAHFQVHDLQQKSFPINYAVKVKLNHLPERLRECSVENILKVKAILSWNIDPTPYGAGYVAPWGNNRTAYVQVRPSNGIYNKAEILTVNNISAGLISGGYAHKAGTSLIYDRPFGGVISCLGRVNIPGAVYYRLRYNGNNILDPRIARGVLPAVAVARTPDASGWFSVSDYQSDLAAYPLTSLIHWNSGAIANQSVTLTLEVANATHTILDTVSKTIRIENIAPEKFVFDALSPFPVDGVTVRLSGGVVAPCGKFNGNQSLEVLGNFRDDHFAGYSLVLFGGAIPSGGIGLASGNYDEGKAGITATGVLGAAPGTLGTRLIHDAVGNAVNLDLDNFFTTHGIAKVECAYGVQLVIGDRVLVGYVSDYVFGTTNHTNVAFATFNWAP